MKKVLAATLLAMAAPSLPAQEAFSTLEERMTGKEFTQTGLSKLTAEELAALNDWLRAHSVATLRNATQSASDARGLEARAMEGMEDSDIVSRIDGLFTGWQGKGTLFKLENGMIWKQAESGTFHTPDLQGPVVTIESGMFNSWHLKVEGYNRTVRVERIQ